MTTAQPVTSGIATIDALLAWTPAADPFFVFNRAAVPLVPRSVGGPRMLDCQGLDFGPYPPQGSADPSNYTLGYWQSVDVFTFFGGSVCFTTPPPGWINAGHRNGVPVLGTFFARAAGDIGALATSGDHGVAQMVAVAQAYGFDGWFFNMEESPGEEAAQQLIGFLASLRTAIHAAIPGSLIVWYDSLLPSGSVDYQNELNANNAPFFNVCDAIFPNFWWTVGGNPSPENSASYAQSIGADPLTVYTPVDCYGRRSPSSGFQSWVALEGAAEAGTSVGMFCPAWTWQNANTPLNGTPFPQGDAILWGGIANVIAPRAAVRSFPFVTHFDQGFGNQFCIDGRISSPHWAYPWSNISQQDVLPSSRWTLAAGSQQACSIELSNACPFDGGSCLKVGGDPSQGSFATYLLFVADAPIPNEALTLSFTMVNSQLPSGGPAATAPDVAIGLIFDDATAIVALSSAGSPCNGQSVGAGVTVTYTAGTSTSIFGNGAAGTSVDWTVISLPLGTASAGKILRAVVLLAAWSSGAEPDQPVPFLDWTALGELKLLAGDPPPLAPVTGLACEQVTWTGGAATLNLTWTPPAGVAIRHYDIYQDRSWIGRAFCPAFWVGAAIPHGGASSITFGVRCADTWGNFEALSSMATVTLTVPSQA